MTIFRQLDNLKFDLYSWCFISHYIYSSILCIFSELVISTFEKSLNRIPLQSVDVQISALPSIRSSPPDIRAIYAQQSRMMRARGGNADGGARWASLALVVIALCELFVGLLRASPRVGLLGASFAAIGFFVGTIGLG